MSLDILFGNVQSFAAFVLAVTTIGGSLMWVYQKTIGKAKEKRMEEESKLLREKMDESNKPLIETLNRLNKSMDERIRHDDKLDDIADQNIELLKKHNDRLDDHHERLVVLEVKNDIRQIRYIDSRERVK
ncbi:hypothetical protein ACO1PF_00435 [Alkalibacterium sp. f15]|uniref:hypothetical protein n=1 Tax=Alkalibacterium sp. f15 TaxID=3414029 RepID=UPI003BF8A341